MSAQPVSIVAGDTAKWTASFAEYSAADGWQLDFYLRKPTGNPIHLAWGTEVAASGSAFAVTVAAATSANWTAGEHKVTAVLSKSGERYSIDSGVMLIKPNLASTTAIDDRSHVQKVYESLLAVIEGRATSDDQEYAIGGRSLKRMSIDELLKWKAIYGNKLAKERGVAPNFYGARFGRI